ncbi:MAG: undecaprenyldiphospho-muramoylpentapeptide beta-N-acetylglucosaminyltransferase [Pseudomonadota bacterium]
MSRIALLAAGGSGGHIFPAQALAEELRGRGWTVHLATDGRAERFAGAFGDGHVHVVRSATFSKNPLKMIKALGRIWQGYRSANRLIAELKPDLAVGFGGYPSFLPIFAASRAGVPTLIHEANAVLGRANKALASRVDAIAMGFPLENAGSLGPKLHVTGNPVRQSVIDASRMPYAQPELGGTFNLVVFGGSQGAQFFSQVLPEMVGGMAFENGARLRVVQQARPEDESALRAWYADNEIEAEVAPFFSDMADRLAQAHLVISRAGASTVTELAVVGRPAILVPYPHALDHDQATNAKAMAQAGGVIVMDQTEASPQALREFVEETMSAPERLAIMAQAALSTANPDAARLLADRCEAIASRDPKS